MEDISFLCVIVTVTTSSVGEGVINFEDVLTSVAVTVCVEVSMMVVTTLKEVRVYYQIAQFYLIGLNSKGNVAFLLSTFSPWSP